MNSGPTSERVYAALKQRVLSLEFRPGERLDAALLGETLSSSVTPVRDALHRLTGEGLIETRTAGGFSIPMIDAPALCDRHSWALDLALLTLREQPVGPASAPTVADNDYPGHIAAVFAALAARSSNPEHSHAIASANDRLHQARLIEPEILSAAAGEASRLLELVTTGERKAIRQALVSFTRKRQKIAAAAVRALYRR